MPNKWTIKPADAGQRLDVFLASKVTDLTRSGIAKRLKAGAGTINAKRATVHAFLKTGDKVAFDTDPKSASLRQGRTDAVRKSEPDPGPRTSDLKLSIVKETPDWMVIDKPAGLLVHPEADDNNPTDTLIDLLIAHHPPLARVGEEPSRPGIVHRLDRDVSGLMAIAKTQFAFDDLKRQFAQRLTQKTYLALVHGAPPQEEGEIRFRIARSAQGGRMAARPEKETKGKAAWSHYRVLRKIKNATLLEVQIFSGRTHQIRAHLFALGCPVVGDTLYKPKTKPNLQPGRLMLQSVKLAFLDPKTQEMQTFTLDPDQMFDALISGHKS
jgi:23S rRNA pseudouridine1911/1915/1917 synthase